LKDVATSMGIVPENEFTLGCECAGTIRRLGEGVTGLQVGDRVAVLNKGTYANRIRVPAGKTHIIPAWLSFEDAATIPVVYTTALYSLFHLGNLKEGQVRTIHP
jgi:NADPH:quinone reductase-like Zn-dependent oxidoreductase